MSIKIMSAVWQYDFNHGEQAIMLALADHANDKGGDVFPSMGHIAWKTGYSKRQVQRIIGNLRERGILVQVAEARWNKPTEYRIDLSKATPKEEYKEEPQEPQEAAEKAEPEGGDKMSPHDIAVSSHDIAMSQRGDIAMSQRGDIAVSPEPSLTIKKPSVKRAKPQRPGGEHRAWFAMLCKVCQYDERLESSRGRIARMAKKLAEAGYTIEDVEREYSPGGWWYRHDWRGQKDQPPKPEQIQDTIAQALPRGTGPLGEPRVVIIGSTGGQI